MNSHNPPEGPGREYSTEQPAASPGTSEQQTGPALEGMFGQIRGWGLSRSQDRWMGGVAGGIAERLGIDPLIVRGLFLILSIFAGVGILAYGLAWAFLPEPDGRIHVQEATRGRWTLGMTGAMTFSIIGLPNLGRNSWGWMGAPWVFWTIVPLAIAALIVFWAVRAGNSQTPAGSTSSREPAAPGPSADPSLDWEPQGASAWSPNEPPRTEGTAGYSSPGARAWEQQLPHKTVPAPPPPRPRRKPAGAALTLVALGLALLLGGGLQLLDLLNIVDLGNAPTAVSLSVAAAVFGLAIVLAGFRGRTTGALSWLAIIALFLAGVLNIGSGLKSAPNAVLGDARWTPGNQRDVAQGYNIVAGNGTVDLTRVVSGRLSAPLKVEVAASAANVNIRIPDNVPVRIEPELSFSRLQVQDGAESEAAEAGGVQEFNTGQPGEKLIVQLRANFSNINILERTAP